MHRRKTRWNRCRLAVLVPYRRFKDHLHRRAQRATARIPILLTVAGLVLVSWSAFDVARPLGLLVAGICCWLLEGHLSRRRV